MNPLHLAIIKILEMYADMLDAVLFGLVNYFHFLCERERVILSMVERTASYERRKKWREKKSEKVGSSKGG